jgi:gas vesicle protein
MRQTGAVSIAFLSGTLAGLAAGATLGLLLAPAKGSQTRRKLLRRAEEIGDRVTELANDAKEAVEGGRRRFA